MMGWKTARKEPNDDGGMPTRMWVDETEDAKAERANALTPRGD